MLGNDRGRCSPFLEGAESIQEGRRRAPSGQRLSPSLNRETPELAHPPRARLVRPLIFGEGSAPLLTDDGEERSGLLPPCPLRRARQCPVRPLVRCAARVAPRSHHTAPTAARNPARSPSPLQTPNLQPTGFRSPAAEARGHARPRERSSSENKGLSAAQRSREPGPLRTRLSWEARGERGPHPNLPRDAAREQSAC